MYSNFFEYKVIAGVSKKDKGVLSRTRYQKSKGV
jgi:hypothetical protein